MLVPIQPSPPTTKEPHGLVVGMLDFYSDDLTSSPVEPIRSQFSKNNFLLFMGKDNIKGEIRDYGDSGVRSSSSSDSTLAAKEKYDSKLVEDIKILIRVFVLYLPLPVFWALFKQQVTPLFKSENNLS